LTADVGIVVQNVATALAVHDALRHGRPLISRVMTVSGGAIQQPRNIHVPLGTRLSYLIDFCGGFKQKPARLISGGPMMGQPVPSIRVPVVKGSNGLLALTDSELHAGDEMPCIRCASCVQACPCGLVPLDMAAHIRAGSLDASVNLGLLDCIACGSCSYVCPSHIPLVHYFNYAKGELAARQRAQHKQHEAKREWRQSSRPNAKPCRSGNGRWRRRRGKARKRLRPRSAHDRRKSAPRTLRPWREQYQSHYGAGDAGAGARNAA
jgi:electron transport complex protein RnfC